MLQALKYRLYPTKNQVIIIDHHFDACRLIWNLALEVKKTAWQTSKRQVSLSTLESQLIQLKETYSWLYDINAQSLQSVLSNLDGAFKRFFAGNGYPRFKKKSGHQSFRCPGNKREIDFNKKTLTIPKIKNIPIILSKNFSGQIKTVTISRTPTNKYFASILVENGVNLPTPPSINHEKTIGTDVGIKDFVITSDGIKLGNNECLKNSLNRLKCLQHRATVKKRGSNNHKKANKCVAILHERISNQRFDYIHKITTGLIRDNQTDTFVIEDLNVAGMVKNRKLSRAISDVGWGEFRRQMAYKCEWYGKNLIVIGRFEPSSKTCSNCLAIKDDLTLKDREWTCANCGVHHDRDLNAAINIKRIGLEQYARRGTPGEPVEPRRLRRTKKQEIVI